MPGGLVQSPGMNKNVHPSYITDSSLVSAFAAKFGTEVQFSYENGVRHSMRCTGSVGHRQVIERTRYGVVSIAFECVDDQRTAEEQDREIDNQFAFLTA